MHISRTGLWVARGYALGLFAACGTPSADAGQTASSASTKPAAGSSAVPPQAQAAAAASQPTAAGAPAAGGSTGSLPTAAGASSAGRAGMSSAGRGGSSAGAGASTGAAGASGASGASAAQPASALQPMERAGKYVFESATFSLELDPTHGARITRLALSGQNLLSGPDVDALNYGSTFWPSPQERWSWPPVPELDSDAYSVQVEGDSLVCSSKPGMRAKVSVVKRLRVSADALVDLEYSLKNEDSMPAAWAPWEITRVAAGGLSFFPTGERVVNAQLPVMNQGGATWYRHDGSKVGSGQKLSADAAGGFLAHVAGRTLFVKQFMDVPIAQQAPAPEAEIAIYAAAGYVELEPQGPYTMLMPAESVTWRVRWQLRDIPQDVPIEIGSSKLLELARQLATR